VITAASVAGYLGWMAVTYGPLERLAPARPQRVLREGLATDLVFFLAQVLLWLPVLTAVLDALDGTIASVGALRPLRSAFAGMPGLVQLVVVVVLGDLLTYAGHRAQHAWEPLWRFHAVHHTPRELDWLSAWREHPLDGLQTQVLVNVPAIVLGVDVGAWTGFLVVRGAWAVLVHANVRLPLGPLKWVLGAPELHRAHHAALRDPGHYANLAPWIDVVFGTHGPTEEPERMGVGEPHPTHWPGLLLWPFRVPALRVCAVQGRLRPATARPRKPRPRRTGPASWRRPGRSPGTAAPSRLRGPRRGALAR
jgi:sterol desaturase/sphingolipid hydroxylase (fatty acid hydroxylase superfamily)